jgi:hypothetical protein
MCAKWRLLSEEGCHPEKGKRFLKAIKALWGLISRPILHLGFFLKANVTTKYRKTVPRKSSFRKF